MLRKAHLRRIGARARHCDLLRLDLERRARSFHTGQLALLIGDVELSVSSIQTSGRDQVDLIRFASLKLLSADNCDDDILFDRIHDFSHPF